MKIKLSDTSLAISVCALLAPIVLTSFHHGILGPGGRTILYFILPILPILAIVLAIIALFKKEFGIHVLFVILSIIISILSLLIILFFIALYTNG